MLVGFSDRLLTGQFLETPHLAAINLMAYILWLMQGIFQVIGIGATALVARAFGAGDRAAASRVANQAFLLGAVLAAVALVLVALLGERFVLLFQLEGEAARLATTYLYLVLPALPLIMAEVVGIACLRAAGDMITGLVVMALVNVVNVALSWSLMLGLGPLPELGWTGIAVGTTCGFVTGGTLILAVLLRGRWGLRLRLRELRPAWGLARRLLRIGIPGGLDILSIIGCQLWFVSLINRLGDLAAAAHGIAIVAESLAFLPGVAFQVAATTLTGQYLGAGDPRRATRSVLLALACGGGVMIVAGAILFAQSYPMAQLFVSSEQAEVARQAAPLLRIVALAIPALAATMILSGALRGAGDTRWPLLFSLVGFVGVRIPATYWLAFPGFEFGPWQWTVAGWGLGVAGAWYAMTADLSVRAVLVVYRFWHGGWQRVRV